MNNESENKKYYGIKCPYCDNLINTLSSNKCPNCGHELSTYQLFTYNMWLAENDKITKVDEKPSTFDKYIKKNSSNRLKDIIEDINKAVGDKVDKISVIKIPNDFGDQKEYSEDDEESENLIPENPFFQMIHKNASETAGICYIQYYYLRVSGFNDKQAMHVLDKLIENDVIFYGGEDDE